ncbi:hypothetical protein [Jiangella endophytica]|uniref:hypothetical protein n=1 Tax=Jiangella endophytica TaxID=1623398 RepID=UPI0013002683|nr:hypothetical protein [Jiangella endophytica]
MAAIVAAAIVAAFAANAIGAAEVVKQVKVLRRRAGVLARAASFAAKRRTSLDDVSPDRLEWSHSLLNVHGVLIVALGESVTPSKLVGVAG